MTTGRINQVTILQGTRAGSLASEREREATRTLWALHPFKGCSHFHSHSGNPLGRPRYTRPHGVGPVRPTKTRSIFATSFHCFTLVSFRHTSRTDSTVKSTECQEDTSGKNDSSESKPLFLAKGHLIQHPSVLSLSSSRQLGCKHGHFLATLPTKQVWSTLLLFPQNAIISYPGTLTEQGLLLRTDTAQLLIRSFPTPTLLLVPEILFSPLPAWRDLVHFWTKNLNFTVLQTNLTNLFAGFAASLHTKFGALKSRASAIFSLKTEWAWPAP